MTGYDDGRVKLTDREIIIRHHYLPGPKRIPYTAIRQVIRSPQLAAHGLPVTPAREPGLF